VKRFLILFADMSDGAIQHVQSQILRGALICMGVFMGIEMIATGGIVVFNMEIMHISPTLENTWPASCVAALGAGALAGVVAIALIAAFFIRLPGALARVALQSEALREGLLTTPVEKTRAPIRLVQAVNAFIDTLDSDTFDEDDDSGDHRQRGDIA
jgi:hypothetical protein